jgi:hypothetical protein
MGNKPKSRPFYWRAIEAEAHLPEIQALIRRAIYSGRIYVRPAPGGGIHISRAKRRAVEDPQTAPYEAQEDATPIESDYGWDESSDT